MPSLDRLQIDVELELRDESIEALLDRLTFACCRISEIPSESDKIRYWSRVIGAIMTCREEVAVIREETLINVTDFLSNGKPEYIPRGKI